MHDFVFNKIILYIIKSTEIKHFIVLITEINRLLGNVSTNIYFVVTLLNFKFPQRFLPNDKILLK